MDRDKQIQPLSKDPLANMSIEDLEQRLEMQMLLFHLETSPDCSSFSCGTFGTQCGSKCTAHF
jgi:hypothetical protein